MMELTEHTIAVIDALQERIIKLRQSQIDSNRIIIALAGIPGSGKSTIAARLSDKLRRTGVHDVVVVPMVT